MAEREESKEPVERLKTINRLDPKKIEALAPKTSETGKLIPNKVHDGGGLYVVVSPQGNKSFVMRYTFDGKAREDGLGAVQTTVKGKKTLGISLSEARNKAQEYRVLVGKGLDPRQELRGETPKAEDDGAGDDGSATISEAATPEDLPTFRDCMIKVLDNKDKRWKNEKHRQQWHMTLNKYAEPLHDLAVAAIAVDDVERTLKPHWHERPETADRLRSRIAAVIEYAIAKKWRTDANPATAKLIKSVMPERSQEEEAVASMKAMPHVDAPAFYARLAEAKGKDALALRFTILNASRSGEVRLAVWDEIDFDNACWTIPPNRLKRPVNIEGKPQPHKVPLSDEAIAVLRIQEKNQKPEDNGFVFPGSKPGKPLSDMTLTAVLRRWKLPFHVHGFRSTFRDWAAENNASFELAEKCLGHAVGDRTSRAYFRSDLFDQRRELMAAWAAYLTSRASE
ncbi:Integrase [Rhizobium sp. RU20A]|uniref:tyrosine-type recombinase/integrase n=1 Tax=Rhizobium sp. RU20A TaxID=1907412 RepID=UPI0009569EBE|nr:site-specific integrase [Rhizobium sp. RU20A]SIQ08109.1 Integrase [Rhizobium sp. RU20A]